ncbi:hypothetical protein GCM10011371_25660 [Novosphingobium marinum]|uniref:Catechol 2,3-dioxygenase-like lactoylglutathione lyase family enzyme n=1 Tax=Novosphingobium marinum TaxID=1514948 RepID=A0A7Z0BT45_9SPHN|nr:VOC family protein [Novosphingobium marinum]NYH94819.1 catechol 2,3-dioxygenase-like lactoylglutathione lyase family enzyme [Novosphingobium marinum]GGC37094.1 hypothetical protein GCM10011371_25660 [Novosphingobium marinum]
MIVGIHHVALHTANLDRIVDFYRRAFGFKPVGDVFSWANEPAIDEGIGVKNSAARTVMLKAGTCYLEVFEYSSPPAREGEPLRPNDHGYTHFCVDVTDIETEYERLKGEGMTFAKDSPMDMGEIKAVYGKDPDGNVIEIQEVVADHDFALSRLSEG